MFKSNMNINENYFYMPFGPVTLNTSEIGLKYNPLTWYFVKRADGTKWRKRLLFNTGWGQPYGYERLPELSFDDLLKLALLSDHKTTLLTISEEESNKYGAISVIMENHMIALIDFLDENLNNEQLWSNQLYKDNLRLFCFDQRHSNGNGGVRLRSYEDMLNDYSKWKLISMTVKNFLY